MSKQNNIHIYTHTHTHARTTEIDESKSIGGKTAKKQFQQIWGRQRQSDA